MKTLKIGVMLLALLLAAMIMVPMVSAAETSSTSTQMVKVDPKTDTLGFVAVDVITIDPAVKNATPYYQILVLNDEGKQNLLNNIDSASSVVASDSMFTTEAKTSMKASLTNLWKKYPVIYDTKKGGSGYPTYGGTITTIRFAPAIKGPYLTDQENLVLNNTQTMMNEIYSQKQANAITPMWATDPTHKRISYWAAYKESFPQPDTVSNNAPVPDSWYDTIIDPFKAIVHSWYHYYDPVYGNREVHQVEHLPMSPTLTHIISQMTILMPQLTLDIHPTSLKTLEIPCTLAENRIRLATPGSILTMRAMLAIIGTTVLRVLPVSKML